jgi:hypothetical protein
MAMMGDSIARSMGPAFEHVARKFSWTFIGAAHNRCTVIHHMLDRPNWGECYDSVPVTQQAVLAAKPDLILVSDNWIWVDAIDEAGTVLQSDTPEHVAHVERRLDALMKELTAHGAIVVLLRLVPESIPLECANEAYARAAAAVCKGSDRTPRFDIYNGVLERVAAKMPTRVRLLDLTDVLCPAHQCSATLDGIIVRFDTMHFSLDGARWLAPHVERKLAEVGIRLAL